MQKQGEDFFGISYYSTACMIISNCSYALEMEMETFCKVTHYYIQRPKTPLVLQAEKNTSLLLFSVASTSLQVSFQTGVRPSVETERNYGFKMHCILTRKKINGDGDVGVFLQLARLCGTRVDVDAVYFTHDRP